ncbi:ABC transporter ATP-binding protein [Paralimibaculum aggregatum]|uniref:ABC transporter ATP-binding protein n=1 Tax=Paralimibaculum aggregatum TaxID=3036245 RepID=A0ABQ6LET0_9RHOB|nr:ATP-binding cassette domain-containing protein [Limibaculum sp. NKW23]GMG81855.1 ABC transporter ATP-binding protein [Limibaculum sp. NKW23]
MWGVRLSGIELDRGNGAAAPFHLEVANLAILAGPGRPNRVPIMGPSGAGKSTLLNLLAGVVWPTGRGGEIAWTFPDGASFSWGAGPPRPADLIRLRQRYFGYAFQTATLQPHLTIGENLTYRLEIAGTERARAQAQAKALLASVFGGDEGYARHMLSRFDSQVSGGEKQRIALMQALIHDPYVLFADEPTGSLDHMTRHEVMDVLHYWLDDAPDERLLIWVTHHENDPVDNGTDLRVQVDGQGCGWQRLDASGWADCALPEPA